MVTCSAISNLVGLYDMRTMKLITATQTNMPTHIKFMSRYTNTCCIVSPNGQFTVLNIFLPKSSVFGCVNMQYGSSITAVDVSMSNQALAFGDNGNVVSVHATCDRFSTNSFSNLPEFADPITQMPYYSLINDNFVPLSQMAPLDYNYHTRNSNWTSFLSHMPASDYTRSYRPVPHIRPEILDSMRVFGNVGYVNANSNMVTGGNLGGGFRHVGNGSNSKLPIIASILLINHFVNLLQIALKATVFIMTTFQYVTSFTNQITTRWTKMNMIFPVSTIHRFLVLIQRCRILIRTIWYNVCILFRKSARP